jgi:hypothetical protein
MAAAILAMAERVMLDLGGHRKADGAAMALAACVGGFVGHPFRSLK